MKPVFRMFTLAAGLFCGLAFSASGQQQGLIGKTNFLSYLEEAPPPPPSIQDAARIAYGANILQPDPLALQRVFQPIRDKVERAREQYRQAYAGKYGQGGDAGQASAAVNSNPIVAGMGGVEKVQQMDEAQAEAAARQAAAGYQQDIMQSMGGDMAALYQKMLSDPAYRERFEKMNDQEKAMELQKYMGPASSNNTAPMAPHQMAKRQQSLQSRDKVRDAMEVNEKITAVYQQLQDAAAAFGRAMDEWNATPVSHEEIEAEFNQKYNALPEIVAGEAGRQKDPEQFRLLKLRTAEAHRERAANGLKHHTALYGELKQQYKLAVSDYLDYMSGNSHKVNGDVAGLYDGTNTELAVIDFEISLLGLAEGLAKWSEELTQEAASWEKYYQETLAAFGQR